MITIERRHQFCSGHRVNNHEGKCRHMHGHNYVVFFEATSQGLDPLGRVIDFSVLKERLCGWIDRNWDHKFLYWKSDEMVRRLVETSTSPDMDSLGWTAVDFNPTAENMADHLLRVVAPMQLLSTGVTVIRVRLFETENCVATASLTQE